MKILNFKSKRNPLERVNDDRAVAYEISDQDLLGNSGGGVVTALQLTMVGRCSDDIFANDDNFLSRTYY